MSDELSQHDERPLSMVPEASSEPIASGGAGTHEIHDESALDTTHEDVASSPPIAFRPVKRTRAGSSTSHVDLGHFDPHGVEQLRTTMSRTSNLSGAGQHHHADAEKGNTRESSSGVSEHTLIDMMPSADGPFDFEKTLRAVLRKCVLCFCVAQLVLTTSAQGRRAWYPEARARCYV